MTSPWEIRTHVNAATRVISLAKQFTSGFFPLEIKPLEDENII